MQELLAHIPSPANKTSPGIDNITYNMIYYLPNIAKQILLESYNYIFFTSNIPHDWNKFTIIPILKPHKLPYIPTNYRLIALTCCCRKIYEKITKAISLYRKGKSLA